MSHVRRVFLPDVPHVLLTLVLDVPHTLHDLMPHVPCALRVLVLHVHRALCALVPHMLHALYAILPHVPYVQPVFVSHLTCMLGALVPLILHLLQVHYSQDTLIHLRPRCFFVSRILSFGISAWTTVNHYDVKGSYYTGLFIRDISFQDPIIYLTILILQPAFVRKKNITRLLNEAKRIHFENSNVLLKNRDEKYVIWLTHTFIEVRHELEDMWITKMLFMTKIYFCTSFKTLEIAPLMIKKLSR